MFWKLTAVLSALLIGWGALPSALRAEAVCGQRGQIVAGLDKKYAEKPTAMGLSSNGTVLEVLASDSGSWTLIITHPNGISCLLAAGEDWENLPRAVVGTGVRKVSAWLLNPKVDE
jgi:hypothetical protein